MALPKSTHSLVRDSTDLQDTFLETYALEESVVTIQSTETGEGDKKKANVVGTFDRTEHDGVRIALGGDRRLGVRTHVTIEKFDNTDIPKKVSVKVDDQRAELIKKTGEFAIQAIKFAGFASTSDTLEPPAITLPLRINLSRLIGKSDPGQSMNAAANPAEHSVPGNVSSPLVEFSAVPPDAVPIAYLDTAKSDSFFYYAACRSARVRFLVGTKEYSFTYKVSDPHFLQRVRMPLEGSITMHTQCGSSVTGKPTSDDASTTVALASALATQAQAIKDTLKKDEK